MIVDHSDVSYGTHELKWHRGCCAGDSVGNCTPLPISQPRFRFGSPPHGRYLFCRMSYTYSHSDWEAEIKKIVINHYVKQEFEWKCLIATEFVYLKYHPTVKWATIMVLAESDSMMLLQRMLAKCSSCSGMLWKSIEPVSNFGTLEFDLVTWSVALLEWNEYDLVMSKLCHVNPLLLCPVSQPGNWHWPGDETATNRQRSIIRLQFNNLIQFLFQLALLIERIFF